MFAKINDIRTKSDNSERLVNGICGDIRDLDYAKKNLSATTVALKNIQTIVQEMERLKTMNEKKRYSEVGNLLEAVKAILKLFNDWKEIDRIKEIQQAFDSIKSSVKTQVFNEFEYIDISKLSKEQIENLVDACFVIDAFDEKTRKEFISRWSDRQLGVYDLKFKTDIESSQIENVDQRYNWFLDWLSSYETNLSKIFPSQWRVSEAIAEDFCIRTSDKMLQMLEKNKSKLNVNSLKTALKKTIKFETYLSSYFAKLLDVC